MRSYRMDQPRPKPKHRSMQDTATPGEIFVHNGCTASLAIPCWYLETRPPIPAHCHDRMHHDMIGWPTPTHPDHCCQEWDFDRSCCTRDPRMKHCPPHCEHFLDMGRLIPIHLKKEGYQDVAVKVFDSDKKDADGIKATGVIDDLDDWVIRVTFDVHVADLLIPEDGTETYYYSVYLNMKASRTRDLAAMGKLTVLPSPHGGFDG